MRREFHVRFCEGGGVRFPSATRRLLQALDGDRLDAVAEFLMLAAKFAGGTRSQPKMAT